MDDLPIEIWTRIFKFLPYRDRLLCASISRAAFHASRHPSLWKCLHIRAGAGGTSMHKMLAQRAFSKTDTVVLHLKKGQLPTSNMNLFNAPQIKRLVLSTDEDEFDIGTDCSGLFPPTVEEVRFTFTAVSSVFDYIIQMPNLRVLDMNRGLSVSEQPIKGVIKHCPHLESLLIGGYEHCTSDDLEAIATLKHLKHLRLVGVYYYHDEMELNFGELGALTTLETLKVHHTSITENSLCRIVLNNHNLRVISLQLCYTAVTEDSVTMIANHCSNLESLKVGKCVYNTDVAMFQLAQKCNKLRILDITYNNQLTDETLMALSENCLELVELWIPYCYAMRDVSIFLTRFKKLETLSICNCKFDPKIVKKLRIKRPYLFRESRNWLPHSIL